MVTMVGCASTDSVGMYVIEQAAVPPSGYSAAVLARRIVPVSLDDA